jgi:ribosomal protein L37E
MTADTRPSGFGPSIGCQRPEWENDDGFNWTDNRGGRPRGLRLGALGLYGMGAAVRRHAHGICPKCGSAGLHTKEQGLECANCGFFGKRSKFTSYPMGTGETKSILTRDLIKDDPGDWDFYTNHRKGRSDRELP